MRKKTTAQISQWRAGGPFGLEYPCGNWLAHQRSPVVPSWGGGGVTLGRRKNLGWIIFLLSAIIFRFEASPTSANPYMSFQPHTSIARDFTFLDSGVLRTVRSSLFHTTQNMRHCANASFPGLMRSPSPSEPSTCIVILGHFAEFGLFSAILCPLLDGCQLLTIS